MNNITVIGPSIFIKGNIEGNEDLSVQGRIEGNISLSNTLYLEESGIVKADVSVKNAVVSGVLVGNLEAADSIEITEIGIVVGDLYAPRIVIRDGAKFRGSINMSVYDNYDNETKKIEQPKSKIPTQKPITTTTNSSVTTYGRKPVTTTTPSKTTTDKKPAFPTKTIEKKPEPVIKSDSVKTSFSNPANNTTSTNQNSTKTSPPAMNSKIEQSEADKINKAIKETIGKYSQDSELDEKKKDSNPEQKSE
ncbi:polymer-forming cytoskeletal protein [bacterium]|nr:polymer-forming cytoskeletal protein [bacterium]